MERVCEWKDNSLGGGMDKRMFYAIGGDNC